MHRSPLAPMWRRAQGVMVHVGPALVGPFHSCISDDDTRKQRSHLKRPSVQPNPEILLCSVPKAMVFFFLLYFFSSSKAKVGCHNHHTQMKSRGVGCSHGHDQHGMALVDMDGIDGNQRKEMDMTNGCQISRGYSSLWQCPLL